MKARTHNARSSSLTPLGVAQLVLAAFWLGIGLRTWTEMLAHWPTPEPSKFLSFLLDFIVPLVSRLVPNAGADMATMLTRYFRRVLP